MTTVDSLDGMEKFYMALADKTRLRLLNLMRQNEVCVCFFTEVLGDSQPKISRHLAYLRNAGIVQARRDGKWVHYSIVWPEDEGERGSLEAALDWLGEKEDLRLDLQKYETVCCTPELLVQIARTPIDFLDTVGTADAGKQQTTTKSEHKPTEEPNFAELAPAHNELEEFLL